MDLSRFASDKVGLADRLSRYWTYRWPFEFEHRRYEARLECGWRRNILELSSEGRDLASNTLNFFEEDFRLQELSVALPGGELTLQAAPRTWFSYGLRVSRGSEIIYQSHENPFAMLTTVRAIATFGTSEAGKRQAAQSREHYPAMLADLAVGLIVYVAAISMSLQKAALVGVAATLLLHPLQWSINRFTSPGINLTGGVSAFAVVLLMLSAAFAWLMESELAIQLRPSALGLAAAACLAADAWTGGKYFGQRIARYVSFVELDPARLSWGSAFIAVVTASLNAAIALGLSRDTWLLYKFWISPCLSLVLGLWALARARKSSADKG